MNNKKHLNNCDGLIYVALSIYIEDTSLVAHYILIYFSIAQRTLPSLIQLHIVCFYQKVLFS